MMTDKPNKSASKLFVTAKKELSESLVLFLSIAKAMAYHQPSGCISSTTAKPLLYLITRSVYQKAFAMMIYKTSFW